MYFVLLIVRLLLAGVFLIAGVSKLVGGLSNSRKALAEFGVPSWLAVPTSIALPWVELAIACLLVPNRLARIGAVSAVVLLLTFSAAIALNLVLGRRPRCNCFGQLNSKPIGWMTFTRNSALASLAGCSFWISRNYAPSSFSTLFQGIGLKDLVFLSITAILLGAVAFQGFLSLQLFRQNGRLLLRIEALEGNQPHSAEGQPVRALPASTGLAIGTKPISFDLPNVEGGKETLSEFLDRGKPLLLIFTDPKCGPCNSLLPGQDVIRNASNRVAVKQERPRSRRPSPAMVHSSSGQVPGGLGANKRVRPHSELRRR